MMRVRTTTATFHPGSIQGASPLHIGLRISAPFGLAGYCPVSFSPLEKEYKTERMLTVFTRMQKLPREKGKQAYMEKVKQRYKFLPEIKRIDR